MITFQFFDTISVYRYEGRLRNEASLYNSLLAVMLDLFF